MFELAHTGTLFLDEVGELEPRMQVKLLRVLDGVPYYRLGSQKKTSVDVRILAATNQNLEQASAEGRFRSDLYHRLNEYQIRVPPLRERVEDIIPLAEHFLSQQSTNGCFSPEAKACLKRYQWPGNIRELRNAVINSVIAARQYEIGPEDLPARVTASPATAIQREDSPGGLRLESLERDAILSALAITDGHHQRAADLLGISRRTLTRKLRVYRGESAPEPTVPA
jgi:DNA-binding NtrC family response regulator